MQKDNSSQLKLIDLISQTKITSIDDFPVDVEPNRIKEKKESLKNTLNNRFNIPMSKDFINNLKENNLSFDVINADLEIIQDGNKKPINVKDSMLENIRKASAYEIADTVKIEPTEAVKTEIKESVNISNNNDDSSVEQLINQVNSFREKIDNKMQKIKSEKAEIENLNTMISDLSVQYDEVEKELESARMRELELQNKIIEKFNSQISSLDIELKDISKLSDEVSQQKNETNEKIVEFKKKISMTHDEIDKVNDEINKKEQILALLDKKIGLSEQEDNEQVDQFRKVA